MKKLFSRKKFTGTGHVLGTGDSSSVSKSPPGERPQSENPLLEKLENKNKKPPPNTSLRDHLQQLDEGRRNAPLQFCQEIPETNHKDTDDENERTLNLNKVEEANCRHEMELNISVLLSLDDETQLQKSIDVLRKVLRNLIANPLEAKFRKLNLTNSKVQELVVQIPGAMDFLMTCGFALEGEQLIFKSDQTLQFPKEGLTLLNTQFPESRVEKIEMNPLESANGVRGEIVPRERKTQVLLLKPTSDSFLPDWFFKRTTADIKAEYFSTQRKRELDQTLMTREQRERIKGPKQSFNFATIRVRLPEGILLQGEFDAHEKVLAVHVWVTDQLRDPTRPFELVLPSREKLKLQGTIKSCSLMPTTLMSFYWSDGQGMLVHEPTVIDEILTEARIDWD
eukprot:g7664.t1